MSNSLNCPTPLSATETDALLIKVKQQIKEKTFDASDVELLQQMVESLGDSRGMVRLGFAEALGKVGKPAVPYLLTALTNHANVVVRRAAAKTLTLIAEPSTIPTLVQTFLHDEDRVVQSSSVGALARMGEAAVSPLLQILADKEAAENAKGHAAWALAFISSQAKEQIYQAYDSDSQEVRSAVVGAVAKIVAEQPEAAGFEILMNALKDTDVNVRSEAAAVLGNLSYQPAMPILRELLTHSVPATRKAAALAIMKMGDLSSIDLLKTALQQETEQDSRQAIALAIQLLQKKVEEETDDDWD